MNMIELLRARPELALYAVLLAALTVMAVVAVVAWADEKFEEVEDDEFDC